MPKPKTKPVTITITLDPGDSGPTRAARIINALDAVLHEMTDGTAEIVYYDGPTTDQLNDALLDRRSWVNVKGTRFPASIPTLREVASPTP